VTINFGDVFAQSARGLRRIQLYLYANFAASDMESASKTKQRRNFSLAATGFSDRETTELVLY
jgi:hypothetical protein